MVDTSLFHTWIYVCTDAYQIACTHEFVSYSFIPGISGTICGVLSMQAMLFAIGVGSGPGQLALSGSLNWILKDGLGQLGNNKNTKT